MGGGALSDLYKSKNKDMVNVLELDFFYLYKTKSMVSQIQIFPDVSDCNGEGQESFHPNASSVCRDSWPCHTPWSLFPLDHHDIPKLSSSTSRLYLNNNSMMLLPLSSCTTVTSMTDNPQQATNHFFPGAHNFSMKDVQFTEVIVFILHW